MTSPATPWDCGGVDVQVDVGIASQHRARLKARIAGNVAAGMMSPDDPEKMESLDERAVARTALRVAEEILAGCGL